VWAHDAQPHNARLTWSSTDFGRLRAYELRNPGSQHPCHQWTMQLGFAGAAR
jgi:hypothetical protein